MSAKKRVEKRQAEAGRSSIKAPPDIPFFQVKKAGTYRINIIPFVVGKNNPYADEGDLYFERTYHVHRGVGAEENAYVCPRKSMKKPCPICDDRAALAKDPDTEPDVLKSLKPQERQLWLLEDLANKEKGLHIWDFPTWSYGKLLDEYIRNADEGDGYENFADPEKGFTLKLVFSEETFMGRNFFKCSAIEFKPRGKPLDDDLLNHGICLDDCVQAMEYEALKKIYLQLEDKDEDDDEDEDEDETPKKKGKKPVKDDDDDDDDEDDSEVEPTPKKKGKAKTAKELGIKVGSMVEHDEFGECEVMKVSGDGTSIMIEDEDGKEHRGVDPNEVTLLDGDEDEEETPKKKKKPAKEDVDVEDDEDEGSDDEDDEDEDEDEEDSEPAPKKGKSKPKPVEDEDDDEDEDDSEIEPAPKKKGKKPPVEDDDDEDDDDDDEDDDDEEEEPAPKKKPKK